MNCSCGGRYRSQDTRLVVGTEKIPVMYADGCNRVRKFKCDKCYKIFSKKKRLPKILIACLDGCHPGVPTLNKLLSR